MKEIWKDIPGYEGIYQVSNLGNVKSLNYNRTKKEKLLKPSISKKRMYLSVTLCKNKKLYYYSVHQLVAMAFLNHIPNGNIIEVDHIDENKLNNKLNNLQLLTSEQNTKKSIDKTKTSSKYFGVSYDKSKKKWVSYIKINGKNKKIGCFFTEKEAKIAYDNELLKQK
jgi:hypothetical protein